MCFCDILKIRDHFSEVIFLGPNKQNFEYERVQAPRSLSDVPSYIKKTFSGFFKRYAYIFRLVWESGPWILFLLMLVSAANGLIPVLSSYISKDILNEFQKIIQNGSTGSTFEDFISSPIIFLFVFFFICKILSRVANEVSYAVTRLSGELVTKHIKTKIMIKAKELDVSAFDMPSFYEKLENANREAGVRPVQILSQTFTAITSILVILFYFIALSSRFPMIALVMIAVSLPTTVISFIFRHKNFNYIRKRSLDRRQMNYYSDLMVNKDMVKEIKILDLSDTFTNKYRTIFDGYYSGIKSLILKENIATGISSLIASLISCAFYIFIGFGVFNGEYMIGDYSFYTGALSSISSSLSTLISVSAVIYEGTLFVDNLMSFLNEKNFITSNEYSARINVGCPHTVEFKNVSFKYPETDKYVLKNINVSFSHGETIALVGLNGAGKTTFIKLLTRLYDPSEGEILLDGVNIKNYDIHELYRIFGIIFQDFGRYAVSVAENISYGSINKVPDINAIMSAAKQSNADEYIEKLPHGYDTQLTKLFDRDATELSTGQWQKLAIARAFYSDSDILILDEPTASLDPLAEQEIFNQFDLLRKNKITLFVSHRLSSATIASKIIVLENGEITEEGSHKELMKKKGEYFKLFTTQATRYTEV